MAKQRCTVLTLLLACLVFPASSFAISLEKQRELFQDAEQALKKNHLSEYRKLVAQIEDYPLVPYLRYQELSRSLSQQKPAAIKNFLDTYDDTPLAQRLHYNWLRTAAKRQRWDTLVEFYYPTSDTALECQYRSALIKAERMDEAIKGVEKLWLSGRSRPDTCDPVFDAWREAGKLSTDLAWQRIRLAMRAGQTSLARYLARYVPKQDRHWVDLWYKVHRNPDLVRNEKLFGKTHEVRNTILVHGMRRLAYRNTEKAILLWNDLKERYTFSLEERNSVHQLLAMLMAQGRHPDALTWLSSVDPDHESQRIREWRVRTAIYDQDWTATLAAIAWLAPEEQNAERWLYWRARAMEALGFKDAAQRIYSELAVTRNYHGFLAADRLHKPYAFQNQPLRFNSRELKNVENLPGILRARELFRLDRLIDARREWMFMRDKLDRDSLMRAAKLAENWGWHSRAIFTVAQTGYWDDVSMRFPLTFQDSVLKQADAFSIEPAWVYGIMRQESAFVTDARSGKGALGLMQLMPSTGRYVAKKINTRMRNPYELLIPDRNIQLGSAYLRNVRDRLYDHPVLATAAYNAGPHRVRRWLPKEQAVPADIWVETVPYDETRDYMERVMAYTIIYDWRLNSKPQTLQTYMPPIRSPNDILSKAESKTPSGSS
jgi:soluble lytic murein transglycosylase